MISLQANFLNNASSLSGISPALRSSRSSRNGCVAVKVSTGQNGRSGDPNAVVLTESAKSGGDEAAIGSSAVDLTAKSVVASGGVRDVYGEDSATEDQHVTPWVVSVARNQFHLTTWGLSARDFAWDYCIPISSLPLFCVPSSSETNLTNLFTLRFRVPFVMVVSVGYIE